ncbi:uncharacterized protein LOC122313599 [Carya illinoinensis]|uniref:uncharacterized protein LOC122313599 n=1 Tax=Carya illinoinensis TaxID=32201 RepID=UPI001C726B6E|nr:uncharacterized protein LOC122313599 [Carya illinoinensis]
MVKDKFLGPDEFSMGFFQACWAILKDDLMKVFQEFYSAEKFEKSRNATFLALKQKKVGAAEIKEFRSISLVNGVYKIISKDFLWGGIVEEFKFYIVKREKERNEQMFKDKVRSMEELKAFFSETLCTWAIAVDFNGLDLHDFLLSIAPM